MKRFLQKFLAWRQPQNENYNCKSCGYTFPKKGAQVSGWNNHPYGFHVHCPKCGSTVDQFIKVEHDPP